MTFGGELAESLIVLAIILQRCMHVLTTFSKTQIEVVQFHHLSIHDNVQQKEWPPKKFLGQSPQLMTPLELLKRKV